MGCCVSTKKPTETAPPQLLLPPKDLNLHLLDRALVPESDPPSIPTTNTTRKKSPPSLPSPPPLEEETVKEVLSETPSLKPNYPKFHEHQKILRLPSFPRIEQQYHNKNAHFEEISEVSEICSVSESISTSAMTEQSRDFDEVLQNQPRIFDHSPSKIRRKRSDSGEFYSRGGSPVRRSVPQQQHRQQWNQNGVLRDHGESSRRRSRSPATRVDAGVSRPGMSPSPSKRGVRHSGRNPSEINRNFEEAKEGKRPVKESLEDPLVSLECFIFL